VFGPDYLNDLPVTELAADRLVLPVAGGGSPPPQTSAIEPWQRWNDYGIGQLVDAQVHALVSGQKSADLRSALQAFAVVEKLGRPDGPLNEARVQLELGNVPLAEAALRRAAAMTDPAPRPWTLAWLRGQVYVKYGRFEAAERQYRSVLEVRDAQQRERGFDFSRDYVVINELGTVLFERAKSASGEAQTALYREAVDVFERVLRLDAENVAAHYNLYLLNSQLGHAERAEHHRSLHAQYKVDDNARDRTVAKARADNPAANHAAAAGAIHPLRLPRQP
jgi:tetratricopeptide (TPR) repeat protein